MSATGEVVTTAGALIRSAKKRGVKPLETRDGRKYYQLERCDEGLRIADKQVPKAEKDRGEMVYDLVRKAKSAGLAPYVDQDGAEYFQFVFDAESGTGWVEGVPDDVMRKAKAVSPKKRKK